MGLFSTKNIPNQKKNAWPPFHKQINFQPTKQMFSDFYPPIFKQSSLKRLNFGTKTLFFRPEFIFTTNKRSFYGLE